MKNIVERASRYLNLPLELGPRGLLVLAALLLIPTYFLPLWKLTMYAPQYPDGLRLGIYSFKLEGANAGQDVKEINLLNHYIGMKFVIGALALLLLRTAVLGKFGTLVDLFVVFVYFGAFSLWSFGYKLYSYGHHLAPTAAVKVAPFMPPLFGHRKLANFDVYSYPAAVALLLAGALWLAWRESRSELASDSRMAG